MKKPIPFGKYYLLERINVGGMAEVFRAKAYGVEGFERLVAVKRILPNIAEDKEFIKMFIDEAKIAVQLNHANIAQIFDLGMVDNAYYIALEHVHGRDLRAIFDRCRTDTEPMPISQACFVVMKVCEGLDYAHNKRDQSGRELNLVHRDVSPQNILVSFEGEVKLIDFGIAKAAGKGSKTQAGILKGKFGYMSPEQVRGLPIDRRSDIFSCGIVLYELLTGERLFVGESDFSTLEKVRNVEILPPSTYNRKIPDELERIVLKALAKDTEDRYQNAIDLHDELQAFVYTAGEFYSRKDLAAWMKRMFSREIEEETSKLESYRQLRPPEVVRGPQARRADQRRSTMALPSVAGAKTPPPVPAGNGRRGQPPAGNGAAAAKRGGDLEWDDDELETQIYDDPKELGGPEPGPEPAPASLPHAAAAAPNPRTTAPMGVAGAGAAQAGPLGEAATPAPEPDLSSLVRTARGWEPGPGHPAAPNLASGSSQSPSPFPPGQQQPPPGYHGPGPGGPGMPTDAPPHASEPSAVVRLINTAEPIFDSAFASAVQAPPPRRRWGLLVGLPLALVALGGGGFAAYMLTKDDDKTEATVAGGAATAPETPASAGTDDGAAAGAQEVSGGATPAVGLSREVLAATGFDLLIDPSEGVKVKLNGEPVNTPAPMQIRNLTPGDHMVEIEAPPGFFSKTQTVTVAAGEAPRVSVQLEAIEVVGRFVSEPPGAKVTLVTDGQRTTLGNAPAEAKLDPRRRYEVVFERSGYVTVTKPVQLSGRSSEQVAVVMERASRSPVAAPTPPRPSGTRPDPTPPTDSASLLDRSPTEVKPRDPPVEKRVENGTLALGSKPPCDIFINGRKTDMKTPQRGITLPAGRHRITLMNSEHGIKENFVVTIKADEETRVIKNFLE